MTWKPVTDEKIAARMAVRRQLIALFAQSIDGAASPRNAAEYVVNSLTVHHPDVLALAAATFAPDEIRALVVPS